MKIFGIISLCLLSVFLLIEGIEMIADDLKKYGKVHPVALIIPMILEALFFVPAIVFIAMNL